VWIQGKGLTPDVTNSAWSNPRAGTDPVLDAGLQQLGFPAEPSPSPSPSPSAGASPSPTPASSASPS
jgi:hypothetical protein